MTPAEINKRNTAFWTRQTALTEQWMAAPVLREHAISQIRGEHLRGTPIRTQRSLEEVLADAADLKSRLQSEQASRAARAKRPDALQTAILSIVETNPRISGKGLLRQLCNAAGPGNVIREVSDTEIKFFDRGVIRTAAIDGLKDRLSRARKQL